MYRVLIVDDEKMIRMGIRKVIQWEKLGVEQVFTAASAREALQILEEQGPQIMITDIQMSEMSGLELIEEARKRQPELRVLVLTGYDSFEYARQSLRLKVQDFFLKPVDETDLSDAIEGQIRFLEHKKAEAKSSLLVQRTRGLTEQIRLEAQMRDLVHRRGDSRQLLERMHDYYGLDRFYGFQVVLIIPPLCMANQSSENNFQEMSMKNICISIVDAQAEGVTFIDDDGALVAVYFLGEEEESVPEKSRELADILQDEFDCKPKMVIGSVVECLDNLYISYHDARHLLDTEKEGLQDIVQLLGEQNKNNIFQDIYTELKGMMCSNIGNTEYVLKAFRTFTKAAESYNLSRQTVRRLCFELASSIYFSYLGEAGETEAGKLDALSKSLRSASREEACAVTEMFLSQMLGSQEENVHDIVAKAKYYIAEHLTEELTVSNIAVSLYITPNYFSRLFKRVTKEGCNEYIVRKRIEKAKSLLDTTSLKIGEIAMMVGYRDTNYFSLAFKKHTGKSPTKYREEIQGVSETLSL
ncbi:MAG: response regulator [Dorea sp.]|uniref:response regulator transcription factor n=1 Tax=Sporofaciens sp. JLR.KK001 TaxID=3112621 RepID=UPI00217404C2|nr:response regulator [Dorea sp.]